MSWKLFFEDMAACKKNGMPRWEFCKFRLEQWYIATKWHIRDLIFLTAEQRAQNKQELVDALERGMKDLEEGNYSELSIDEIFEKARQAHEKGEASEYDADESFKRVMKVLDKDDKK